MTENSGAYWHAQIVAAAIKAGLSPKEFVRPLRPSDPTVYLSHIRKAEKIGAVWASRLRRFIDSGGVEVEPGPVRFIAEAQATRSVCFWCGARCDAPRDMKCRKCG